MSGILREELGVHEVDAEIAANLPVGVHWQIFRNARTQALAGCHRAVRRQTAARRLQRAYRLLEHGRLEEAASRLTARG